MGKGWEGNSMGHSEARLMGMYSGAKKHQAKPVKFSKPKFVEKPKKDNKILSYSDSDAYDAEKEQIQERLKEDGVYPEDADAELEKRLKNADTSWYYDDFKENLTAELKAKNPDGYWFVEGEHLDWRGSSGEKYVKAYTAEEMLEQIAPKTSDYSVDVFRNGAGLSMRIYHHDVPMGSLYVLHKVTQAKYEKETGVY